MNTYRRIKDKSMTSEISIKKRMRNILFITFLVFTILIGRIGFIQIIQGGELTSMAYEQQTLDRVINPKRGTIYDSTGKYILAISSTVETVTVNPGNIAKEQKELVAKKLSELFELDYEKVLKKVTKRSSMETIAKKIEKEKADELRKWMEENKITTGINIDEDTKRYYPNNSFAAQIIGFCGSDNQGLDGIEAKYEKEEKEKPKKRIELPIEEIVKKWKQGVTQKELSKEYGVSEALIGRRISEYYEKEEKGKPKQRIELPIEEIVKKWEQGVTQKELSKEYGVSGFTISKRISEYYEKEEKKKPKQRIELPIEEIVKKWERGITQKELSKRYGVSKSTISKRISKYYQKKKRKKNEEKKAKILRNSSIIVEYLRKGLTIEQIESIASKQNIIVPQEVKEKAIQKIEQLKENKTNESNER